MLGPRRRADALGQLADGPARPVQLVQLADAEPRHCQRHRVRRGEAGQHRPDVRPTERRDQHAEPARPRLHTMDVAAVEHDFDRIGRPRHHRHARLVHRQTGVAPGGDEGQLLGGRLLRCDAIGHGTGIGRGVALDQPATLLGIDGRRHENARVDGAAGGLAGRQQRKAAGKGEKNAGTAGGADRHRVSFRDGPGQIGSGWRVRQDGRTKGMAPLRGGQGRLLTLREWSHSIHNLFFNHFRNLRMVRNAIPLVKSNLAGQNAS